MSKEIPAVLEKYFSKGAPVLFIVDKTWRTENRCFAYNNKSKLIECVYDQSEILPLDLFEPLEGPDSEEEENNSRLNTMMECGFPLSETMILEVEHDECEWTEEEVQITYWRWLYSENEVDSSF